MTRIPIRPQEPQHVDGALDRLLIEAVRNVPRFMSLNHGSQFDPRHNEVGAGVSDPFLIAPRIEMFAPMGSQEGSELDISAGGESFVHRSLEPGDHQPYTEAYLDFERPQKKSAEQIERERQSAREYYEAIRAVDAAGENIVATYRDSPQFGRALPTTDGLSNFLRERASERLSRLEPYVATDLIAFKVQELIGQFESMMRGRQRAQAPDLPTQAPARYPGKRLHKDPLEFLLTHYKPWLDARVLDVPSLKALDAPLYHALKKLRDEAGDPLLRKALPSVVEARQRRALQSQEHVQTWDPRIEEARHRQRQQSRKFRFGGSGT